MTYFTVISPGSAQHTEPLPGRPDVTHIMRPHNHNRFWIFPIIFFFPENATAGKNNEESLEVFDEFNGRKF